MNKNPLGTNWQDMVRSLYEKIGRVWRCPTPNDSLVWLLTEIGELADVMMRLGYGQRADYVRNKQVGVVGSQLLHEIGDVQLMLCALSIALGLDLGDALRKRIEYFEEKYKVTIDRL